MTTEHALQVRDKGYKLVIHPLARIGMCVMLAVAADGSIRWCNSQFERVTVDHILNANLGFCTRGTFTGYRHQYDGPKEYRLRGDFDPLVRPHIGP